MNLKNFTFSVSLIILMCYPITYTKAGGNCSKAMDPNEIYERASDFYHTPAGQRLTDIATQAASDLAIRTANNLAPERTPANNITDAAINLFEGAISSLTSPEEAERWNRSHEKGVSLHPYHPKRFFGAEKVNKPIPLFINITQKKSFAHKALIYKIPGLNDHLVLQFQHGEKGQVLEVDGSEFMIDPFYLTHNFSRISEHPGEALLYIGNYNRQSFSILGSSGQYFDQTSITQFSKEDQVIPLIFDCLSRNFTLPEFLVIHDTKSDDHIIPHSVSKDFWKTPISYRKYYVNLMYIIATDHMPPEERQANLWRFAKRKRQLEGGSRREPRLRIHPNSFAARLMKERSGISNLEYTANPPPIDIYFDYKLDERSTNRFDNL